MEEYDISMEKKNQWRKKKFKVTWKELEKKLEILKKV